MRVLYFWLVFGTYHVFLVGVSVLVARRLCERLTPGLPWRRWLAACAGGAALFGLASVAGAAAGVWLFPHRGFALVRFASQALFGEALLLASWTAWKLWRVQARLFSALTALVPLFLLAVYTHAYHREPWALRVSRHRLNLAQRAPADSSGVLRVVHLSDIQTHRVGDHERRAVRAALQLAPDVIVLTGDFVQERFEHPSPDGAATAAALRRLFREEGLGAPLGVYAVQGDTDRDWPGVLAGTDIVPLTDGAARVTLPDGTTLALVGLSNLTSRGRDREAVLRPVREAPSADLTFVLGHRPEFVTALVADPLGARVSLALAGHTHGGQVALPFIGPLVTASTLPRRYAWGLNDFHGLPLHGSRGVGLERGVAPPIRFGSPPEVCLIEVRY